MPHVTNNSLKLKKKKLSALCKLSILSVISKHLARVAVFEYEAFYNAATFKL